MKASVSHQGLVGSAALKEDVHFNLSAFAKSLNVNVDKYKPIGIEIRKAGKDDSHFNLICIDNEKSKVGDEQFIKLQIDNSSPLDLYSYLKEIAVVLYLKEYVSIAEEVEVDRVVRISGEIAR